MLECFSSFPPKQNSAAARPAPQSTAVLGGSSAAPCCRGPWGLPSAPRGALCPPAPAPAVMSSSRAERVKEQRSPWLRNTTDRRPSLRAAGGGPGWSTDPAPPSPLGGGPVLPRGRPALSHRPAPRGAPGARPCLQTTMTTPRLRRTGTGPSGKEEKISRAPPKETRIGNSPLKAAYFSRVVIHIFIISVIPEKRPNAPHKRAQQLRVAAASCPAQQPWRG